MSRRVCRNCPVPKCGAKFLVKLSYHLAQVHGLSIPERKPYLQEAKQQPQQIHKVTQVSIDRSPIEWFIVQERLKSCSSR